MLHKGGDCMSNRDIKFEFLWISGDLGDRWDQIAPDFSVLSSALIWSVVNFLSCRLMQPT